MEERLGAEGEATTQVLEDAEYIYRFEYSDPIYGVSGQPITRKYSRQTSRMGREVASGHDHTQGPSLFR